MGKNTPLEHVLEEEYFGTEKSVASLRGWFVRKMQWIGRRGSPDRFLARPFRKPCPHCGTRGRVVLVEVKRRGEKPDGQQQREIDRLRNAGVEVHIVDNEEDAKEIIA